MADFNRNVLLCLLLVMLYNSFLVLSIAISGLQIMKQYVVHTNL